MTYYTEFLLCGVQPRAARRARVGRRILDKISIGLKSIYIIEIQLQ